VGKFRIRRVPSGIKFDLTAANGQVVLTSEVYTTEAACLRGIASVRTNAPAAKLEDRTAEGFTPCGNPKFELYRDKSGEYRFRLKARNGRVIGISEGYTARAGAADGVKSVIKNAAAAEIEE